jgi:hypothetical protein
MLSEKGDRHDERSRASEPLLDEDLQEEKIDRISPF